MSNTNSGPKAQITSQAVARVYSATARQHGGQVPKGSFAARLASAATRSTGAKK